MNMITDRITANPKLNITGCVSITTTGFEQVINGKKVKFCELKMRGVKLNGEPYVHVERCAYGDIIDFKMVLEVERKGT